MLTGYLSSEYAQSLAEFGEPVTLPNSGLSLLKRKIEGTSHYDLRGLYPLAMAPNWDALPEDIEWLRSSGAISMVLVTDPFVDTQRDWHRLTEWDVCRRFKTHHLVNLERDWRNERSKQVRYDTRRALAQQEVRQEEDPARHAGLLWQLYGRTIDRFKLKGIRRMTESALTAQLQVPGAHLITANDAQGMTGAMLCFDHEDTTAGHLFFTSQRAEVLRTSFALYFGALEAAEQRGCEWFNLGAGAGHRDEADDGLVRFKRRWANGQAQAWLCGLVLDQARYVELSSTHQDSESHFFPAYRAAQSN